MDSPAPLLLLLSGRGDGGCLRRRLVAGKDFPEDGIQEQTADGDEYIEHLILLLLPHPPLIGGHVGIRPLHGHHDRRYLMDNGIVQGGGILNGETGDAS